MLSAHTYLSHGCGYSATVAPMKKSANVLSAILASVAANMASLWLLIAYEK